MKAVQLLRPFMLLFIMALLSGCGVSSSDYSQLEETYNDIRKECDSLIQFTAELNTKIKNDSVLIKVLRDSISTLSFPANQRMEKIKSLIVEEKYSDARKEITKLTKVFPDSGEAKETNELLKKIDNLENNKKLEEERKKALGFKGIKTITSCKIGYNKVDVSNITIGNTFTFDSYDDYYHYRTADRGNKYITAVMKITSESKNPQLPQPAIYSIVGDKMKLVGRFAVEFARWDDYGSYLGNDHDFGNDFAKTSSVRFKIGEEVSDEVIKKPYAIILKKENVLSRNYERFSSPPVSYDGFVDYPYQLTLEDFSTENNKYYVLKIANL